MKVRDLMTSEVITLDPDDDLALADQLMHESRIRHMPVVDDGYHLVGLITQRDLLRASISTLHQSAQADRRMKAATPISEVMHTTLTTCSPDDELKGVVDRMRAKKFGCMPVINEDGTLAGIVTDTDFMRFSSLVLEVFDSADILKQLAAAGRDGGGARSGEA